MYYIERIKYIISLNKTDFQEIDEQHVVHYDVK